MLQNFKAELRNLLTYLKNPKDYRKPNQSFKQRFIVFLQFLIISFVSSVVMTSIIAILQAQGWVDISTNKVLNLPQHMSIWTLLLGGVFVIPFIEELIFRHPLRFKSNIVLKIILWFDSLFGQNDGSKTK